MQKLFLTFFYTGLSPKAPGTVGTLGGAILGWILLQYFSFQTLTLLTILISIVGINEIDKYEAKSGTHDDKSIVIDEVAGIWLTFILAGASSIIQMVICFIFFRVFDIWKPSLIGRIDKNAKGGLGVMGDDLLAGVIAGICSAGVYQFMKTYNLLIYFN